MQVKLTEFREQSNENRSLPPAKLLKTHSFKVKIKQLPLTFFTPWQQTLGLSQAFPGHPALLRT